jgi:AraC family transcriptional regulator
VTSLVLPVVRPGTPVQLADYPPGSTFGPRRLADYEFVWILRGSALWRMRDSDDLGADQTEVQEHLKPAMLALARAGAVDSYRWDAVRPSTHAYVHFRIEDRAQLPPAAGWPLVRSLDTAPVLAGLCGYLLELAAQPLSLAQDRSAQLLGLLLDLFVRGPLPDPALPLPPAVVRTVDHVRAIWRSGVRIVSVDELAAAAGVSPGHLFRLYRQHVGPGPARALELVRLVRAAVALQRSNASLAQIAALTGFADAYHFSRRFAATYGMPPGAFRTEGVTGDVLAPVRAAGLLPLVTALMTSSDGDRTRAGGGPSSPAGRYQSFPGSS